MANRNGLTKTQQDELNSYNSIIGKIIDLPLEKFKEELIIQKVNIGTINNLIIHLGSMYYELRHRKDSIIKSVTGGRISVEDGKKAVMGLYAEMQKIEDKVTYLKEVSKSMLESIE